MNSAILLFLSRYNTRNYSEKGAVKNRFSRYTGEIPGVGSMQFSGLQTNDAPCKYLLRRAAANGHQVSTILCLVSMDDLATLPEDVIPAQCRLSKADLKRHPGATNTSFTYFCKVIGNYVRRTSGLAMPEIVLIPYDCDPNAPGFNPNYISKLRKRKQQIPPQERAAHIYQTLAMHLSQRELKHLYVDFTGGMRDTSFLLMELSRFLQFIDIPCEDIVYSNVDEKQIFSLQSAYAMFPLLSGISNFLNTGNSRGLQEAYGAESNSIESRLLSCLTRFAQAMSLCALSDIDRLYLEIIHALDELEQSPVNAQSDVTLIMLKDFVPKIRQKFHIIPGSQSISYLGLIQWCLDNGMLQQALTLYVEKLPDFCFRNGMLCSAQLNNTTLLLHKTLPVSCIQSIYSEVTADENIAEFVNCLKIMEKAYETKKNVTSAVGSAKAKARGALCREALNRLEKAVNARFDPQTGSLRKNQNPTFLYYTSKVDILSFSALINRAKNDTRLCHYFLYNDSSLLEKKKDAAQMRIDALERLKTNIPIMTFTHCLEREQLRMVLCYYAAIVALRNMVNHAADSSSGNQGPDANTVVLQYCHREGILSSDRSDYPAVRDALQQAASYMLQLEQQYFRNEQLFS